MMRKSGAIARFEITQLAPFRKRGVLFGLFRIRMTVNNRLVSEKHVTGPYMTDLLANNMHYTGDEMY